MKQFEYAVLLVLVMTHHLCVVAGGRVSSSSSRRMPSPSRNGPVTPSSHGTGHTSYGWKAPASNAGPPPHYSATNPIGGARPNVHEPPPQYHQQSQYHGAAAPAIGHQQHPNTGYHPSHMGGAYGAPPPPYFNAPPHSSYYQPGAALPQGAVMLPAAPVGSSNPGFATGLLAGGATGLLAGHLLTPTHTQVQQAAAAQPADGNHSPVIIINNSGTPINGTADGVTVINAYGGASTTPPMVQAAASTPAPAGDGGIICVPLAFNETDPADNSKLIEVEKIACYPAPPAPLGGSQTIQQPPMLESKHESSLHEHGSGAVRVKFTLGTLLTLSIALLICNAP